MRISVLTLFPEFIDSLKEHSIIKRAIANDKFLLDVINFRDFTKDKHNKVDDYPFGGGKGMVLMCQPIVDAIEHTRTKDSKVYLMSPQGIKWSHNEAHSFADKETHIILVCGHYEGFDERIRNYVDGEISIGDYVLTGGEIPAMAVIDSIVRLVPGVIKQESHVNDSFENGLLDYPNYTKPVDFRGELVPDVLLSGHHKNIDEWRREQSLIKTKNKREDLL